MDSKLFCKYLGKRIKILRDLNGLTQDELAKFTGYRGRDSISKIEKGLAEPPASKLFLFADALHTNITYLMGWDDSLRGLTQEEYDFIILYRNATDQGRALATGNLQASQQDTSFAHIS